MAYWFFSTKWITDTSFLPDLYKVYFIDDGLGYCKIGVAKDIDMRLSALQIGNVSKLYLLAAACFPSRKVAFIAEDMFHKMFAYYKVRGEWYELWPIWSQLLSKLDLRDDGTLILRKHNWCDGGRTCDDCNFCDDWPYNEDLYK